MDKEHWQWWKDLLSKDIDNARGWLRFFQEKGIVGNDLFLMMVEFYLVNIGPANPNLLIQLNELDMTNSIVISSTALSLLVQSQKRVNNKISLI